MNRFWKTVFPLFAGCMMMGMLAFAQSGATSTIQRIHNVDVMRQQMGHPMPGPAPDRAAPNQPGTPSIYVPDSGDVAGEQLLKAAKLMADSATVGKAIDLLKKVVKKYPQNPTAYMLMGVAYSSQQSWEEAKTALSMALVLQPGNARAYLILGAIENETKAFTEAENHLLKAVALAPAWPDAHVELGQAYIGQERWDLARQQIAMANQLRADNPQQHVLLGNILLRERNAAGALKEFQETVRLDPTGPLAASAGQMIERIEAALKESGNPNQ
jgi:tetratricopeptide (TPR) repeat protein